MKRAKVIEPDDEENAVRLLATSADAELSLGDYPPLVYKAKAPQLISVRSFSVKKKKASSSMMIF